MSRPSLRPAARIVLACALGSALPSGPASAQRAPVAPSQPAAAQPPVARPPAAPADAAPAPAEAASPYAAQPATACGAKAARYVGDKTFEAFVTRLGHVQVENPLRPLTPEITEVLQVTIAGRMATAYGADLGALRRGGPPNALEAQLGAPIRWDASLPLLPDPLTIVTEAGEPLARLSFRDCVDAPPVKAPPAIAKKDGKPAKPPKAGGEAGSPGRGQGAGQVTAPASGQASGPARRQAAPKAPPGFSLPQGAIAE